MLTVTTLPQAKLVREAPVGAAASSRHPAKPPVAHLRNHFWAGEVGVMGGHCNARLVSDLIGGPWAAPRGAGRQAQRAALRGRIAPLPYPRIGPGMDAVDRSCIGHTLELAPAFLTVRWVNPHSQARYSLTAQRRVAWQGRQCRRFSGQVTLADRSRFMHGTACRDQRGGWHMV